MSLPKRILKNKIFKESICKKNSFCEWKSEVNNDSILIERCLFCGRRKVWLKKDKELDQRAYLAAHLRDFAQSYGATEDIYKMLYSDTRTYQDDKLYHELMNKRNQRPEDRQAELMYEWNLRKRQSI